MTTRVEILEYFIGISYESRWLLPYEEIVYPLGMCAASCIHVASQTTFTLARRASLGIP